MNVEAIISGSTVYSGSELGEILRCNTMVTFTATDIRIVTCHVAHVMKSNATPFATTNVVHWAQLLALPGAFLNYQPFPSMSHSVRQPADCER